MAYNGHRQPAGPWSGYSEFPTTRLAKQAERYEQRHAPKPKRQRATIHAFAEEPAPVKSMTDMPDQDRRDFARWMADSTRADIEAYEQRQEAEALS